MTARKAAMNHLGFGTTRAMAASKNSATYRARATTPSMTGNIDVTGAGRYDGVPIQSALDIDSPIQNARMTAVFSQNRRLAGASARTARLDCKYALISDSRARPWTSLHPCSDVSVHGAFAGSQARAVPEK